MQCNEITMLCLGADTFVFISRDRNELSGVTPDEMRGLKDPGATSGTDLR
jgi:hypothetical protein